MKLRNMLILSFLTSSIVVVLIVWFSISKMYLTDYDGYLIIGITILANILGTIIGLFSLRNTFHSLDKLSKQTKVIKENQFTEIQLEHAPKELQTLADDFNEMVAALADSFTALEKSEQDKSNLVAQLGMTSKHLLRPSKIKLKRFKMASFQRRRLTKLWIKWRFKSSG